MDDNCWQECLAFLTARGGLVPTKTADSEDDDPDSSTMDHDVEDDDAEVFADQRSLENNWSLKCINRAVLVSTSITPDSNANIKELRPKYWTATEGVSLNIASLPSCSLVYTDIIVETMCVYSAQHLGR